MGFAERPPLGRLRGIVDRLWAVEDATPSAEPETICPDGTMEIVLHLGDAMWQGRPESGRLQSRTLLVGQMDAPVVIAPSGRVSMVGARFAPGAFHRLLPMSQQRLTGQIHDLGAIWNRWTASATERAAAARTMDARLDALEIAIEELLPSSSDVVSAAIAHAVTRMRATNGLAPIPAVVEEIGWSRRQFERHFQDRVGLSPALLARIIRFQHAFQALDREPGAIVAARCGYVDQAHLIREVRRFAGHTPTALVEAGGLTAFFRS